MYSPPGEKGNCSFQAVAAACFGNGNYAKGAKCWVNRSETLNINSRDKNLPRLLNSFQI
ncbi:unnamed protein product [Cunninghamella blakesleeana]